MLVPCRVSLQCKCLLNLKPWKVIVPWNLELHLDCRRWTCPLRNGPLFRWDSGFFWTHSSHSIYGTGIFTYIWLSPHGCCWISGSDSQNPVNEINYQPQLSSTGESRIWSFEEAWRFAMDKDGSNRPLLTMIWCNSRGYNRSKMGGWKFLALMYDMSCCIYLSLM